MSDLPKLRQSLHQIPELAFTEKATTKFIQQFVEEYLPDEVITPIAKTGIAFNFKGNKDKPKVMFRADLDALPIMESLNIPYASKNSGISHKCGHDGHMTMVAAIATKVRDLKNIGDVILFFQPAEEVGAGALACLNDPEFKKLNFDYIFGLHNFPDEKLGHVLISPDLFSCCSIGLHIKITGNSSHAAYPEQSKSPLDEFIKIKDSIFEFNSYEKHSLFIATLTHLQLGEKSFGISPGELNVFLTLRSSSEDILNHHKNEILALFNSNFKSNKLEIIENDYFPITKNDTEANQFLEQALKNLGFSYEIISEPIRWSEDFGYFTKQFKGAYFGLGSEHQNPLHHQDFDFNDQTIEYGLKLYLELIKEINRGE
jgi:amidohydrolase